MKLFISVKTQDNDLSQPIYNKHYNCLQLVLWLNTEFHAQSIPVRYVVKAVQVFAIWYCNFKTETYTQEAVPYCRKLDISLSVY
jgi:hypothetical protein